MRFFAKGWDAVFRPVAEGGASLPNGQKGSIPFWLAVQRGGSLSVGLQALRAAAGERIVQRRENEEQLC